MSYTLKGSTAAWGLSATEALFFVENVSQDTSSKTAEIAGIDGSPLSICFYDVRTTVKISGYLPTRTVTTRIGQILAISNYIATMETPSNGIVTNISINQSNANFAKMDVTVLKLTGLSAE